MRLLGARVVAVAARKDGYTPVLAVTFSGHGEGADRLLGVSAGAAA